MQVDDLDRYFMVDASRRLVSHSGRAAPYASFQAERTPVPHDLALGLQLEQVGVHLAARHVEQAFGRVGVEPGHDVGDLRRALAERLDDLALTHPPVLHVLVEPRLRIFDDVAVGGADARDAADLAQPLERLEVLGHVAAPLRADHGGRAVEHVVAGEEHPLLFEQEAEMVGSMAGRVQRLETELRALDDVAVVEHAVELERDLVGLRELAEAGDLGAGALRDARGRGPVVGVRVREQHPAHALRHRRADDRLDVTGVVGAGVDHRDLVDADEIRVGARARS